MHKYLIQFFEALSELDWIEVELVIIDYALDRTFVRLSREVLTDLMGEIQSNLRRYEILGLVVNESQQHDLTLWLNVVPQELIER